MQTNNDEKMTFGKKLKAARKSAGMTQEQLAEKLFVSRQAITKWEADRGMPDIENIKRLSTLLGISIDFLLDNGETIDMSVIKEEIDLNKYDYSRSICGRWIKKAGKKDMVVSQKYPNSDIHYLMAKQIMTKGEKIIDNLIGFLTDAPFGIPAFINAIKNTDKEFYLVNQGNKQFFVTVTDELIESRQLTERITAKKFEIGEYSFTDCGAIKTNQITKI